MDRKLVEAIDRLEQPTAEWLAKPEEDTVFGVVMTAYDEATSFRTMLTAEMFTQPIAQRAWKLFAKSKSYDDFISAAGEYANENLINYLSSCMNGDRVYHREQWRGVANAIVRRYRNKQVIADMLEAMRYVDRSDMIPNLKRIIDGAEADTPAQISADYPARVAESAIALLHDKDQNSRIMMGIEPLDNRIAGLRKGNVSILGAEPSAGKTAFALNVALAAWKQGKKTLIFSLEMSKEQMLDRLISNYIELDYRAISNKMLNVKELGWYDSTARKLMDGNRLYIMDTCYLIEDMQSYIAELKPDLVIVDFLQFCRTMAKIDSTADRLEYMMGDFKRIAKLDYCKCHIMLLSQPSRQATREGASMFALKGSSGIEQGGDLILLLDRPHVRDNSVPPEQASIRIAKNKFGETGKVDLFFDGAHQRFRSASKGDMYSHPADDMEEQPW